MVKTGAPLSHTHQKLKNSAFVHISTTVENMIHMINNSMFSS